MTLPSVALGVVCSLLIGLLFHLIVDGGPDRLFLYLILSAVGFGAAQWLAILQHWMIVPVGPLQLGIAIPGSIVLLVVGHWLSKMNGGR